MENKLSGSNIIVYRVIIVILLVLLIVLIFLYKSKGIPVSNSLLPSSSSNVSELEVYVDESKGEVVIKGFKIDRIWRGTVLGPSMFPSMIDGGVTILQRASEEELRVGDIIVFYGAPTSTPNFPVVHRISSIGEDREGWYANTLADNKDTINSKESWKVRYKDILGKVRIYIDR